MKLDAPPTQPLLCRIKQPSPGYYFVRKFRFLLCGIIVICGCDSGPFSGDSIQEFIAQNAVVVGLTDYKEVSEFNRSGTEVPGLELNQVRLIRNQQELSDTDCPYYAVILNASTGGLLESRFWEQVRDRRQQVGSPFYELHEVPILLVRVDKRGRILSRKVKSGSYFAISVNTNDFSKQWKLR